MTEKEVVSILDLRGMERKTPKSITSQKKYLAELNKVREYGFALDNEENAVGVRCVAAPVYDANGKIIAALGTSSTIMQIDETHLPKILEMVKNSAAQISKQIGYQALI
jgi:DNA-binding IclR family transcriptional regulator